MRRDDIEQAEDRDFAGCVVAGLALFTVAMLVILAVIGWPLLVAWGGPEANADIWGQP